MQQESNLEVSPATCINRNFFYANQEREKFESYINGVKRFYFIDFEGKKTASKEVSYRL